LVEIGTVGIHRVVYERIHLNRNDDGTFSVYPSYQEVDIRAVTLGQR
jgi:hypothetical protein